MEELFSQFIPKNTVELIGQIIGLLAFACGIACFQSNDRKQILIWQLSGCVLWTAHFLILGAFSGAVLNAIAGLRAVVYINRGKRWADSIVWLFVFIGVAVVSTLLTWEGWFSLLPMTGIVVGTVAMRMKEPRMMRLLSLPSSPLWMVYEFITGSYAGLIGETFGMISIIVGMLRFDRKKKELPADE